MLCASPRVIRSWLLPLFFTVLSACGGGGGGDGNGGGDFHVSVDRSSIEFDLNQGNTVTPTILNATWTGTPPPQIYLLATLDGDASAIDSKLAVLIVNSAATVTVSPKAGLTAGTYTGHLYLSVCTDSACSQRIGGTPIPVAFAVKVQAPVFSGPATATFQYTAGTTPTQSPVLLNILPGAGNWTATSNNPLIALSKTSGSGADTVAISFDATALASQITSNQASTVTVTGASGSQSVAVTLNLVVPRLQVPPYTLSFSGINGTPLAAQPVAVQIEQGGSGLPLKVSADQSWLTLTNVATLAPGGFTVNVNPAALTSGTYTATIHVEAGDGHSDPSYDMPVTLKLTPPTLTVSSNATNMPANGIVLGGTAGRTFDPVPVQIGLNTGANVFSWTVSGAPPWLALDKNSGTVSATQQQIVLTPQRLLATPGTTTANLSFRAVVNGDTITQVVPVSFNLDTHRLIASSNGIAFTSTPNASWQRLDASVSITSNLGLPAAWTATVDNQSAWLHVGTNTGHSGDSFTLHADPTGLAPDQLYTATVTITSSDTTVAAPEVIHVGLWVGSTTPSGPTIVDNVAFNTVKADPIRPYVYAHVSGETTLRVYNLYTGQALPGITGIPDATREMTVSTDGSTLYALDSGAQTITTVDLSAGTLTGSFAAPTKVTGTSFPYDFLKYARPNGVGVVFTDVGGAFLASTGADVGIGAFGYFDITADSHKLFYNGSRLDIDFTSAGGGKVINVQHTGFADLNISAQDVATSGDGSRVYAAAGGGIRRYNGNTFVTQTPLPFGTVIPNNVEMASDGRIFTAATVSDSSNHNIWIYNAADTLVATFLAPHIIGDRRLVVSGDGLILALITGVSDPSLQIIPVGP